ncbi:hypothetical protein B0H13DRAFT_1905436 [Mycena leptocephala]|nr:hypothetical protein B0H13DRAFT_1905436 [Mycena leptocephala]
MSLFCYVWLSFVAMVLCFLVATWAQIMAVTGISPGSILATTAFPLDFLVLFIGLLAARNVQMKSTIISPVIAKPGIPSTKLYRLTVLGPFRKPASIGKTAFVQEMAPESTIQDVLHQLRCQHQIGDFLRIKHHIIFPAHQMSGFMTFLYCMCGHLLWEGHQVEDHWVGYFCALLNISPDKLDIENIHWDRVPLDLLNSPVQLEISTLLGQMRISSHEQGPRHKKNLACHDNEEQANNVDSDSSSESPSIPGPSVNVHLPPNRVLGPLGRTLSQIAKSSTLQQPLYNYPTDSSGVDWDSADYDTQLPDLGTVHMTALAQNFVNYLKDGDIDHDSDDDLEERSQINNSSDSDNDMTFNL